MWSLAALGQHGVRAPGANRSGVLSNPPFRDVSLALLFALPLLLLAAASAEAQEGPLRHSWSLAPAPDAPRAVEPAHTGVQSARRPLSRYPLIGFTAGVAVGIGAGMYLHRGIEPGTDLAGPPAYVVTVPLGIATGVLLGVVANWIHPPSEE